MYCSSTPMMMVLRRISAPKTMSKVGDATTRRMDLLMRFDGLLLGDLRRLASLDFRGFPLAADGVDGVDSIRVAAGRACIDSSDPTCATSSCTESCRRLMLPDCSSQLPAAWAYLAQGPRPTQGSPRAGGSRSRISASTAACSRSALSTGPRSAPELPRGAGDALLSPCPFGAGTFHSRLLRRAPLELSGACSASRGRSGLERASPSWAGSSSPRRRSPIAGETRACSE
mmetsp:Transcript_32882/g.93884  ORF Transcript_32882/g.93884 Transcript_32882/m.93884 type:complete len:229 (+) Transcript_32882:1183-1869(+)